MKSRMVLLSAELFEQMISKHAEEIGQSARIKWGEPHIVLAPTLVTEDKMQLEVYVPAVSMVAAVPRK